MNHYPHHIGDFNNATRHLTRLERSVYRDLIEMYYDTEKALPLDIPTICRKILAKSTEESTAVEQALNEFFTKTPTGWYHTRCETEIEKYKTSNSQKAEAGRASAAKREAKRQQALNGNPTTVPTTVEPPLNGAPTNQEPITKNLEPNKLTDDQFEMVWAGYPKRAGSNPKDKARKALNARILEGDSLEIITGGVSRYSQHCQMTGKINTEFIMQAARFFGPSKEYLTEWEIPNGQRNQPARPSKSESNANALYAYLDAIDAEEALGAGVAGSLESPAGIGTDRQH